MQRSIAVVLALWLAGCASVQVAAGHRAVVLDGNGHYQVVDEGVSPLPATTTSVDDFDVRAQAMGGSLAAVSADGVPLVVHDPVISFAIDVDALVALDRTLGPRGVRPLVRAIVQRATATVLSSYGFASLGRDGLREAQARIIASARRELAPRHVSLSSVELKGVTPRLPNYAAAVNAISVWEQRALSAPTRLELARHAADQLRADAAGVADANAHIAPTLDRGVLTDAFDRAWSKLLSSPTTTLEVAP